MSVKANEEPEIIENTGLDRLQWSAIAIVLDHGTGLVNFFTK
jgi:hypothetical protein